MTLGLSPRADAARRFALPRFASPPSKPAKAPDSSNAPPSSPAGSLFDTDSLFDGSDDGNNDDVPKLALDDASVPPVPEPTPKRVPAIIFPTAPSGASVSTTTPSQQPRQANKKGKGKVATTAPNPHPNHEEVARRLGLPRAASPKPAPKNTTAPDSSNVPPSPAGSLFDGSDGGDNGDVPKLALDDASVVNGGALPPVPEPTPKQVSAINFPSAALNAGPSTTTPSQQPRQVKSKGKGKSKGKAAATATATATSTATATATVTAPKPDPPSKGTTSRPPVTLSSKQQAAYYVTSKTPAWAGGLRTVSTFIPGNASASSSATPSTPGPANPTASSNASIQTTGRPSAEASHNTIQPSGEPTIYLSPNQPPNGSIASGTPANSHTQATQSVPPQTFVSTNTTTTSSLPEPSSNHAPPASQSSGTPSTVPPPNASASVPPPAGHTTTGAPNAQPTASTAPPSGTTSQPRSTINWWERPCIPVCSVPADFVPPPAPLLNLPPPQKAVCAQGQGPFPTQPAPLAYVSPTWLTKPRSQSGSGSRSRSTSTRKKTQAQAQQNPAQTSAAPAAPPHTVASGSQQAQAQQNPPQTPAVPAAAPPVPIQTQGAYTPVPPAQSAPIQAQAQRIPAQAPAVPAAALRNAAFQQAAGPSQAPAQAQQVGGAYTPVPPAQPAPTQVRARQSSTQTSAAPPSAPRLRRAASEQGVRPPQVPVHAQQAQGAYPPTPPAQSAPTQARAQRNSARTPAAPAPAGAAPLPNAAPQQVMQPLVPAQAQHVQGAYASVPLAQPTPIQQVGFQPWQYTYGIPVAQPAPLLPVAQGAYYPMPPAQQAPTQQVQIQPGRYTYGTPVTQPIPSIPVAQVPAATPRVPSASQHSGSHAPPPAQIPTPQANIGGDSFSATAWGAMYAPPLVRAQPSPGHPVVPPAPAPAPVPARQAPVAGPSHRSTRPAVPSRLSQVYTAPSAPVVQKRRMEEDDDEIQEIPPPHKRSRK